MLFVVAAIVHSFRNVVANMLNTVIRMHGVRFHYIFNISETRCDKKSDYRF